MRRSPAPKRTKRIVAKPVPASEWRRIYGSTERIEFVQGLPCLACGRIPSENAHVTTGGTGRKADADQIASLCHDHHHELHQHGHKAFAKKYALDLKAQAARIEARWQTVAARLPSPTGEITR